MAVENDFLVWAAGATTQIYTQAQYAALSTLGPGVAPGIADPLQANKTWRQTTVMASVIAQFIVAKTNQPAIDDGTTATLLANLETALLGTANQGRQVYSTPGTYTFTVPTGITALDVIVTGGGSGAGGYNGTTVFAGPCGGGGATAIKRITGLTPGTQISVTVGPGGAGSAANASSIAGGTSSFGSYCSAQGGTTAGGPSSPYAGGNALGAMGVATGGDVNLTGGSGSDGNAQAATFWPGLGGASYWGGGPRSELTASQPPQATCPGTGGAAPYTVNTGSVSGGAGANGIVMISW